MSREAHATREYEAKLERARELARNDPKMVANLVKEWMGVSEEGRK